MANKTKQNNSLLTILTLLLLLTATGMAVMGLIYKQRQNNLATPQLTLKQTLVTNPNLTPDGVQSSPEVTLNSKQEEITNGPPTEQSVYEARLFFIQPVDGGRFILKSTRAMVNYSDEKLLAATINSLLAGPPLNNRNNGLISMIPDGSKLLSATINNGVAYLDFNDNIRFNTFGSDGYEAELNQIIYTATEFTSVNAVRILVNGEALDFLSEGINISQPLMRK
jgi:spore germination protein GerM